MRAAAPHYSPFTETAPAASDTLSLHDALPICTRRPSVNANPELVVASALKPSAPSTRAEPTSHGFGITNGSPSCRSEEHTSEVQSRRELVCRLLLAKKHTARRTSMSCRASDVE